MAYPYKITLQKYFQKKMTRREFLLHMGLFFLVLTGISGFLNRLSTSEIIKSYKPKSTTQFGNGAYGGIKKI